MVCSPSIRPCSGQMFYGRVEDASLTRTEGLMSRTVKAIPEGYHSLTPYLIFRDADKAIEFYGRAFGAVQTCRMSDPQTGRVMHAELKVGDSMLFLSEENLAY